MFEQETYVNGNMLEGRIRNEVFHLFKIMTSTTGRKSTVSIELTEQNIDSIISELYAIKEHMKK